MPDYLIVHHPKLKSEGLVYVLQTDWRQLKELIGNIRDPSFLWGNLAFTVLGFGMSCLASIAIYHGTADPTKVNKGLLGVGYTTGMLSLVIAALFYIIHRKTIPSASSSRADIQRVMDIVEARLIQADSKEEDQLEMKGEGWTAKNVSLNDIKELAFKSLSKET